VQKEKVLLSIGELKYTSNKFFKDNRKSYAKKEEKPVNMADRPKTLPKAQISTSSKETNYTFPVPPRILLRDIMKKILLHLLEKVDDDTPLGYFEAYCAYHQ